MVIAVNEFKTEASELGNIGPMKAVISVIATGADASPLDTTQCDRKFLHATEDRVPAGAASGLKTALA